MNTNKNPEPIQRMKPGRPKSYSPADIKRWGVERFLDEVCEKAPIAIPDLGFTEKENQRMNDLLKEEREAARDGI